MNNVNSTFLYNNHEDEIYFDLNLENTDISLGNSLRRIMINELPTVAFDPTNIKIIKNTSSLHNQFIEHRLSFIPICMYLSETYNVLSTWDDNLGIRIYNLLVPSAKSSFEIDVSNDDDTRKLYKSDKAKQKNLENDIIINVTSEDIVFNKDDSQSISNLDIRNYILSDLKVKNIKTKYSLSSSEYALINKLKINSDNIGNSMYLTMEPNIGVGTINSIYSPVGTVSFKIIQAHKPIIDKSFNYRKDILNKERLDKNLPVITLEESLILRKEYDTLDAKRVYSSNKYGNPYKFNLKVESIGILSPSQIIYNALKYLKVNLIDIYSLIRFR